MKEAKHPVRTLETTLELLAILKNKEDGGRICDLAEEMRVSESAVHNHLATLRNYGYVVKSNNRYKLGLKFLDLGGSVQHREDLYGAAKPVVENLAREAEVWAELIVEEQGEGIHLTRARGVQADNPDIHIGARFELWKSPAGRTILAELPEDRREMILQRRNIDPRSIDELRAEMEDIRSAGYTHDRYPTQDHQYLAIPIKTEDGRTLGALGASTLSVYNTDSDFEEGLLDLLRGKVNEIETNLRSMRLRDAWIDSSEVHEY